MYKQNPFGNPDGARADLKEIEYSFITDFPYGVQITNFQDDLLNKRVIVGAKGSGKTVYLRKIQSILRDRAETDNTGIYVDDAINQNLNCTDSVIQFCSYFHKQVLSEKWTQLWKISIVVAVAHKFLFDAKLKNYIKEDEIESIKKLLVSMQLFLEYQCSIYDVFTTIVGISDTSYKVTSLIENRVWLQLSNKLQFILRNSPTMYIFLDSVDLEYEHAPVQWISCQKGLFYAVMDYLQRNIWGEKLHIIISLRDNVFTNILRSEHATKFTNETHIFILDWSVRNITAFLKQKIEKLDDCYFLKAVNDIAQKNIYSWLSVQEVENEFGNNEDVFDFIIRHTRNTPRDVIIICNTLSTLKKEYANDLLPQGRIAQWIKDKVLGKSAIIGSELITICAKNIMGNNITSGGTYMNSSEILADEFYSRSTYTKLLELLACLKSPALSWEDLKSLENQANNSFGYDIHLVDVLWNDGIIGYVNDSQENTFYAQRFQEETLLPPKRAQYVVRSCVATKLELGDRK
ncbi:MAG: hypothetical protein NC453_29180 [Muribaculum sp.]|nr:hypothetical protein [Muribaculum sp.]